MVVQVGNMAVPLQLRQQQRQAPQVTARGSILQSAAPTIPKQDYTGFGKALGDIADTIKETRQQANRKNLVEKMVAMDEMGEGDAFDATVPQVQADGMEGMMLDSGEMGGPSTPATPNNSPLDILNMPDGAKKIFKDLVNAGQTDDAFKIAMAFAMKPPKEYTLGKDQVVKDAQGKTIAEGPKSTTTTKTKNVLDKATGNLVFVPESQLQEKLPNGEPRYVPPAEKPKPNTGDITDNQILPILNLIKEGKPVSRQQLNAYSIWYANASKAQTQVNPATGQLVTTRQDMSQFPKPNQIRIGAPTPAQTGGLPQNQSSNTIAITPPSTGNNMAVVNPNVDSNMPTTISPNQQPQAGSVPQPQAGSIPEPNPESTVTITDIEGLKKKPLSAESAGKVAMAQAALNPDNVDDILDNFFESDGTINRQVLLEIKSGQIITPKAQAAYNAFYRIINGRLRIESGAAVPETEVQREMKAMLPTLVGAATNEEAMTAVFRRNLNKELNFFNGMLKGMGQEEMQVYFGNVKTAPLEEIPMESLTQKQQEILDERLREMGF